MGIFSPKISDPAPTPPPPVEPTKAPLDEESEARVNAAKRAQDEAKRRNRTTLRTDLASTADSGGAGVYIP
jgi:hypothetical protein